MTAHAVVGSGRVRALQAPLGVAALAVASVGFVAVVDPNEAGHYPTCPFLAVTGYFCPGCGSLRAVHALAHGDLGAAVGLNVLTVLAALALGVGWVGWAWRAWSGSPRTSVAPSRLLWALVVVVCVFGVLRNLPVGATLAP